MLNFWIEERILSLIKFIYRGKFSINYVCVSEIPDTPCFFAFNHSSSNDCPNAKVIVYNARYKLNKISNLNKRKIISRLLVSYDALSFIQKRLFNIMRYIPVNRHSEKSRKASMDKMVQAAKKGYDIITFPEATWNISSDIVKPFHKGTAKAARETRKHIVPVAVHRVDYKDYYVSIGKPLCSDTYVSEWSTFISSELKKLLLRANSKENLGNVFADYFERNKLPRQLEDKLIDLINNKSTRFSDIDGQIFKLVVNTRLPERIKHWVDVLFNDEMLLRKLSDYKAMVETKTPVEGVCKSILNFDDSLTDTLQYELRELRWDAVLPMEILLSIVGMLTGIKPRETVENEMRDFLEELELSQAIENSVANLLGNMVFDESIQKPTSRSTFNPSKYKERLLQKENGFVLDYENESRLFHRKRKYYYCYATRESKPYVEKEDVPVWSCWDYKPNKEYYKQAQ